LSLQLQLWLGNNNFKLFEYDDVTQIK